MKNRTILLFSLAAILGSSSLKAQTVQNWKTNGNALTAAGKLGTTSAHDVNFISNNVSRMSLKANGVFRINSDQTPIQFSNAGANPKPMMFIYESGVVNTSRMVFAYSPQFPNFGLQYTLGDKLDFLGGGISAMTVDLAHKSIGIGTTNTENFKVKIVHGNNLLNGLAIENSNNPGIEWSLFTGAGNSPLNFIRDGALLGQISFPTGQYLALSDERLKTNIRPMSSVLEKIKQLKPSTYQFKKATEKQDHDGFIAQDVMKIFPALVSHTVFKENNTDVYTMDYSGFGVIAIKGLQELMKQNDSLKSEIGNLKTNIMRITTMLNIGSQSTGSGAGKTNIVLTDASLEQNIPNPVTNSASIGYNIPSIISSAQIIITDRSGRTMKQVNVTPGKGTINIDASVLTPGTYNYSLVVNGKVISTKQMMVAK